MDRNMTTAERLRYSICPYILLAVAIATSVTMSWNSLTSPGWETPWVILALGLLMSYDACRAIYIRPSGPRGIMDSVFAWLFLVFFFILAVFPWNFNCDWLICWCLWTLIGAPLRFFCGNRVTVLFCVPMFIFCVFLPMQDEILLVISHPLRLMATLISGSFLQLCGANVAFDLTLLKMEDVDLAITDACSGIQQFEALLFIGYILVKMQQKSIWWGVLQYAFVLPSVIIANSIRLILVVALYHWPVGENVLYAGWHEGLGYFQVLLAVGLLWCVGELIQFLLREPKKEFSGPQNTQKKHEK